ncbi:uncharacterized protein DSM5745_07919 [Aspergillus mulundensis]|uniref:Extracellular membrane protein CFEM domain-containing protein n=1 Tax=Aspergillus mulundensis TaxID=1810919 RepID=A0A3D8RFD4_9EURO|nr:hypothetical protein DSM5745_07919 [Aspergillus mulundensis]RDW72747.1 hypothetical protein DSM5745_07919 [Aspergillus mulundensis]
MRSTIYLGFLAALRLTAADQVGYFNSDDCADPSGFASCYEDADEWYADCINENCLGLGKDCHDACEYARQGAYTRCAATSCWNMVYSCEYQQQASDYVTSAIDPDLDSIPFWPAPDKAAGRCSCPIGDVTTAQVLMNEGIESCGDYADPFSLSADQIESIGMGCLCCGWSGWLSSLDSFCPRLNPAELGLDGLEQFVQDNVPGFDWSTCQQWLDQYDCVADFGYPASIQTYYGPGNIPEGGTETLSNIGALTTPVSETVTFTIGSQLFPVTAVSTDASVPTGSSDSNDSSDNDDSSSNEASQTTADSSQETSVDQTTEAGPAPTDAAIHQVAVSKSLLALVAVILGVIYIL